MAEAEFEFVVLAPAQRSGSTLLQRILNANPETLVWGEHGAILKPLVAAYWQLVAFGDADLGEHRKRLMSINRTSEWTANASPPAGVAWAAAVAATRTLLSSLYCNASDPAVRSVGFKEVAYGAGEIALIQAAYPDAKIILLVRDPASTLQAIANQRWNTDQFVESWSANVLGYIDSVSRFENVWLFRYEDLASAREETVHAVAKLARTTASEVTGVLGKRVGGPPGYSDPDAAVVSRQALFSIERTCGPILEQLRYISPNGRPSQQGV